VVFILSLFVTVFLHELGHSLMAKRFNVKTNSITLLPIGGVASLERIPEKPKEEILVALAGPAVNLALAFITYFFISIPDAQTLLEQLNEGVNSSTFLLNFFIVNIWLSVFNLLPAFPMDGGRVFRALLSFFMPRHRATWIAARLGQLLGIGFIILGISSNPFLAFIGVFIILGAQSENQVVQSGFALKGTKAGDLAMRDYPVLSENDTISKAAEMVLNSQNKVFLILTNSAPSGTLGRDEIILALSQGKQHAAVAEVMNRKLERMDAEEEPDFLSLITKGKESPLILVYRKDKLEGVIDIENVMEYIMIMQAKQNAI
jgi:Zn-dependent protease